MISFLLPTKSRADLFMQCYGSLLINLADCPEEWEIIIVNDNPIDDGVYEPLLRRMAIQTICTGGKGIAEAYNIAATAAVGDKIIFVNDDLYFFQPFINPLLETFENGYSIVGAKLLYPNMTIQHGGVQFVPGMDWGTIHLNRFEPRDAPGADEFKQMPTVTFSFVLIDHDLYRKLDGISLEYGGNFEDTDFSLRAMEMGAKIAYEPRCEVIHHESATRGHINSENERTFKIFQKKWVNTGRLQKVLDQNGFGLREITRNV